MSVSGSSVTTFFYLLPPPPFQSEGRGYGQGSLFQLTVRELRLDGGEGLHHLALLRINFVTRCAAIFRRTRAFTCRTFSLCSLWKSVFEVSFILGGISYFDHSFFDWIENYIDFSLKLKYWPAVLFNRLLLFLRSFDFERLKDCFPLGLDSLCRI